MNLSLFIARKYFRVIFCLVLPISVLSQKKAVLFDTVINNASSKYKGETYFSIAQSAFQNSEWDTTLLYSMKQLNAGKNKKIDDYCHYFRGISFKEKGLFNEAKRSFSAISNNFLFLYKAHLKMGEIALEQSDYQQAIDLFKTVDSLPFHQQYDYKKSALSHNIGLCYFHLKKWNLAESYLTRGNDLYQIEKDTTGLIISFMDIANLYYEQYQDELAIPYFEKAYQLSKNCKSFELKQNAALNMAVVEENRKHYKEALVYRAEYEAWRDSLNDQNKVWDIAQLEKQFAVKEKQKEVDVLATENKLKVAERNGFIYVAVLLATLLGTGVYFYRLNVKRSNIIFAQKTELDELNAAKDKLFSIVSHDLRSSVNALKTSNTHLQMNLASKNYLELDQQLQTNSAIANGAYNLLDNLLHWALLQTEQSYFKQESLRLNPIVEQVVFNYRHLLMEKDIELVQSVPKSTNVFADLESLKIVVRNLLDNAIKFSKVGGKISVYVRSEMEMVELVIEDNGWGMSDRKRLNLLEETIRPTKKEHEELIGTGLGLSLCKSLIAKNGGSFGIESEEQVGSKMMILLPKPTKNG